MNPVVDVEAFARDGYVAVRGTTPRDVADAARELLWPQLGIAPDDPSRWSEPVKWAADLTGQGPFGELVRSPGWRGCWTRCAGPTDGYPEARWGTFR